MARMADRILQGDLYYPRRATGGKLAKVALSKIQVYVGDKLRQVQIIDASSVADFSYSESRDPIGLHPSCDGGERRDQRRLIDISERRVASARDEVYVSKPRAKHSMARTHCC